MDDVLDHVDEGVLVVDADWRIAAANAAARELLGREAGDLAGTDVREAFPRSVESPLEGPFESGEPAAVSFEEYFPGLDRWLAVRTFPADDGDRGGGGLSIHFRDVTDRKDRERELEDRERDLATLSRINDLVGELIRELVGATTREEIESLVCERLAESDLFAFAWVGEPELSGDRLTVRAVAGDHEDVLDGVVEGSAEPESPERVALRTEAPRVVHELPSDDTVPQAVRWEAFARGLQSCIAVPIGYGDTNYGVLGVYAARPDAFGERGETGFGTLGETIGFAINAARQRNLLLSDTVLELRFQVTDSSAAFVAASAELDCTVTVEGVVPLGEESILAYIGVEGATAEEFAGVLDGFPAVEPGRVIHDGEDSCLVEVTVSGASPVLVLSQYGGTIRTAEFDHGAGRIVAEVAPDEDVRDVAETVGTAFPEAELVAKRERERAVQTAGDFRRELDERLTERQRVALRTAYFAGYFESPRDSTAQEVAAALDVTSPTFHHHIRAAHRKLLGVLFDETDRPSAERPRGGE